jgi:hypothetical protein
MINSYTSDNTSFFSDPFSFVVDFNPIAALIATRGNISVEQYLKELDQHITQLKSYVEEYQDQGATGLYLSCLQEEGKEPLLYFHGQLPWSKEKIDHYNQVVNSQETELDRLKSLIEKYPDQAAQMLSPKDR